jgi:hypothetical protein
MIGATPEGKKELARGASAAGGRAAKRAVFRHCPKYDADFASSITGNARPVAAQWSWSSGGVLLASSGGGFNCGAVAGLVALNYSGQMHPVLAEILRSREVKTSDGQLCQLHSNIDEVEGKFIQDIIRELRPKCSIEIGCACGVSSLFICEALADIGAERHIVIDPYQPGVRTPGPRQWLRRNRTPKSQACRSRSHRGIPC